MNRVELTGRLVRDPEITYGGQNQDLCIAKYTLAVEREFARENEQDADFIRCVAFSKRAEFAEKYFCKGMKIGVCGRIQTGSYKNKDDQTVYTTDVLVDSQEFEEKKATNDAIRESNKSDAPKEEYPETADGFVNVPDEIDDELPFN